MSSGPSYVQVPGSPFSVGGDIDNLAFDAAGGVLAANDYSGGTVATLTLNATSGALSAITASPFASGHGTDSVAVSPSGALLAATNVADDTVTVFSVGSGGTLSAVTGSPFQTGDAPRSVAFSPNGNLLAVANQGDDTVSVFSVGSGGTLSAVTGSPFPTGAAPVAVSFNPAGSLLTVANEGDGSVSIFTVSEGTGELIPSAGSPLAVGDGPAAVAFNPSGTLLAVANSSSSTISVFTTGSAAEDFQPATGSPNPTGADPQSVAFDQTGTLLATADLLDNTVAVFGVGSSGGLTLVQGAPFTVGNSPHSALFVPNTDLIAVANSTDGTVSVLEPTPPPGITVTVPVAGQSYTQGSRVQTSFSCTDNSTTGIASCLDGSGSASPGLLDTSALGSHTYTVSAASEDGLTATSTVTYSVVPAPPTNVIQPALAGKVRVGSVISCGTGRWDGHPSSYTYQWERGGLVLAGVDRRSYRVTRLDEGSALVCVVTASDGATAEARSKAIVVPLDATAACPAPTGRLSNRALGPFKLGEARATAGLGHKVDKSSAHSEELCLTPAGIELGFPDATLSRALGSASSANHVVWALTANPGYSYDDVAAGVSLAAAEQHLGAGTVEQRGQTVYYLVRGQASTIVVVARGGVVEQIGIAQSRATATPAGMAALVASLPR